MLYALGRKTYQERRRLLFVTALAFIAGVIFYLRANHYVHGVHVSIVTGALYAAVVAPTTLFFCLVLPSIRFMIEAVAVSRLVFSLFVFTVPDIGYKLLASPLVTATIVVAGGILISRVIHGRIHKAGATTWRDRLRLTGLTSRRPARLRASAWQYRFVGWIDDAVPVRA